MNGSVPVSMITPIWHATKEHLQLAVRCRPFCSRPPDGFPDQRAPPCFRHRLDKPSTDRKTRLANFLLTKSQLVVHLSFCTLPLAAPLTSHLYRLTAGRLLRPCNLQPNSAGRKSVLGTLIRAKLHVVKFGTRFNLPLCLRKHMITGKWKNSLILNSVSQKCHVYKYDCEQWRTQEFCSGGGGGGSKN